MPLAPVYGNPGVWGTAGKPPKPKRAVAPKPVSSLWDKMLSRYYNSWMTEGEQRTAARKDVDLAMKDSLRDLNSEYQRANENYLRQQYAASYFGNGVAGMGSGSGPQAAAIRAAYAKAAGMNEATAKGFIASTTGQQAANATQGNEVGATLAGYAGPNMMPSAGANADVLNYLAAAPSETLRAQGEAGVASNTNEAAKAAGMFATKYAEVESMKRELLDKKLLALHDLEAKRPGMLNEALKAYQSGDTQKFAALVSAMQLQETASNNTTGNTISSINAEAKMIAARGKNKREAEALRVKTLKSRGLAPDGKTPLPEYYQARDGSIQKIPYGSIKGKNGQLIKDPNNPAVSGGKGAKGATPTASGLRTTRNAMKTDARKRWVKTSFKALPVPSVAEVVSYLMKQYSGDFLTQYPSERAAILTMATEVANAIRQEVISGNKK